MKLLPSRSPSISLWLSSDPNLKCYSIVLYPCGKSDSYRQISTTLCETTICRDLQSLIKEHALRNFSICSLLHVLVQFRFERLDHRRLYGAAMRHRWLTSELLDFKLDYSTYSNKKTKKYLQHLALLPPLENQSTILEHSQINEMK